LEIPKGYLEVEIGEQTTNWSKEIGEKDKQRSIKHTHQTKDRVTQTPLKTGRELMCSGRVSSSWITTGTCRVNIITKKIENTK
jgi:hypothetical protein